MDVFSSSSPVPSAPGEASGAYPVKRLLPFVALIGWSSIITQVIILREFLSVVTGNELVIGVILAVWMILTGTGASLGKFAVRMNRSGVLAVVTLILLAVFPISAVYTLRTLRNVVFPVGSMIGLLPAVIGSFVLVLPYCIVSGLSFTLFVDLISRRDGRNMLPAVYAWEAIGSVVGGLLFNLVLVYVLKTFQCLEVMMVFTAGAAFLMAGLQRAGIFQWISLVPVFIGLASLLFTQLDDATKAKLFPNQEVIYYKDTPYGNVTVTGTSGQKNFYENNTLLFSDNDPATSEEQVHYAMIQRPTPRTVLLVSGGYSGSIREILKYQVNRIDYVERNPSLIEIGRMFKNAFDSGSIRVINEDARLYIRRCRSLYDVVLLNVPDPGTAQINRYYTTEFFQEVKDILNPGGVVSISLLQNVDYYGGEARSLNSILVNTLKSSFGNVAVVPGSTRNYFLASDGPLGIDIARRITERGIATVFVNRYYFDDDQARERSVQLLSAVDPRDGLNRDFTPIAYYRQLAYWLSYFDLRYWLVIGACCAGLVFYCARLSVVEFGMFAGGFTASAVELLLVMAFQVIYGYVYQMLGIIVTVFMTGLALGAMQRFRFVARPSMPRLGVVQWAVAAYAAVLPFILFRLNAAAGSMLVVQGVLMLLTLVIAFLVGMEFSLAANLQSQPAAAVAASLYSADMIGAAVGALLAGAFLIPRLGILNASYWLAALNGFAGILSFTGRKVVTKASYGSLH